MSRTDLPAHVSPFAHTPGTPEYDGGARLFRAAATPEVVLRPRTAEEVASAVGACVAAGLRIQVRSGGHGSPPCPDGALIDLGGMDDVDVSGTVVWLGAGARWEQVAEALAPHGLVITSGDTGAVGVGGLTLGGGIGWLVRTHGLTVDAVRQIEVVTADGVVRRVSADEDPDLFWAMRGGGGNFGVVTRFCVEAAPAPTLVRAELAYEPSATRALLAAWWEVMADAPDTVNSTLAVMPAISPQFPAGGLVDLVVDGTMEQAHDLLAPLLALDGLRSQSIDGCTYADLLGPTPPDDIPVTFVSGNRVVTDLTPAALDGIAALAMGEVPTMVMLRALGGAFGRVGAEETAFAHRGARALVVLNALLPEEAPTEAIDAVRADHAAVLEPGAGVYGNFSLERGSHVTAAMYPPATLERLRAVKARVDPAGVFTAAHALH
ncbi:FAD-binding oxidoreductase [Ruania alba]|uniref:FAD/FMN-containing dehydrogenase n=1 Tax=Ruania alba TaxID=648782 RepID=A0A1H5KTX5_9MICO|nr:FAD-binding oxidoreductase [Ruania alba]SEE68309.1 FAD/FMN-containing dehydrogenase [Ruania alba]